MILFSWFHVPPPIVAHTVLNAIDFSNHSPNGICLLKFEFKCLGLFPETGNPFSSDNFGFLGPQWILYQLQPIFSIRVTICIFSRLSILHFTMLYTSAANLMHVLQLCTCCLYIFCWRSHTWCTCSGHFESHLKVILRCSPALQLRKFNDFLIESLTSSIEFDHLLVRSLHIPSLHLADLSKLPSDNQ